MDESLKPRMSRRLRILLIVSLAANLLFVGLFLGAAARFGGPEGRGAHGRPPSVGTALYRALPREERRALRDQMHMRQAPDDKDQQRDEFAEIRGLLVAEPFDPAALGQVIDAQIDRHHDFIATAQGNLLARISEMSAEERAAYVARLDEVIAGKRDGKKR